MPLRGHKLIHPRWEQHHSETVAGTRTATVVVTRPSEGATAYDPVTGRSTYGSTYVWSGTARVQALVDRTAAATDLGGQSITPTDYRVSVPSSVGVQEHDRITVYADPLTDIDGLVLRVTDTAFASLSWERVLLARHETTRGTAA